LIKLKQNSRIRKGAWWASLILPLLQTIAQSILNLPVDTDDDNIGRQAERRQEEKSSTDRVLRVTSEGYVEPRDRLNNGG